MLRPAWKVRRSGSNGTLVVRVRGRGRWAECHGAAGTSSCPLERMFDEVLAYRLDRAAIRFIRCSLPLGMRRPCFARCIWYSSSSPRKGRHDDLNMLSNVEVNDEQGYRRLAGRDHSQG